MFIRIGRNQRLKFLKEIFDEIIWTCPNIPPETGGILGSKNGLVVDFLFDKGIKQDFPDQYVPDINKLNKKIENWINVDIEFCGMFHTHFPYGKELSEPDKRYITEILNAVPKKMLYFPIVFPNKDMIVWKAELLCDQLILSHESIELINKFI